MRTITLEISTSSHPEFELFASVVINGRQVARRGNRTEIDAFANELTQAAAKNGVAVTVKDETR